VDLAARRVQALILCPTRELADQVSGELRRLGRFLANLRVVTLTGGVPVRTQTPSLEQAPHVVVGTPGRVIDHLERGNLALAGLDVLVLDEADRMLDMGFAPDIESIVAQTPVARQTQLFSATFPEEIRAFAREWLRDPAEIVVAEARPDIEEIFYRVDDKLEALVALLLTRQPESALVFCTARIAVRELTTALVGRGFAVAALHGELEQRERDEVLIRFANRSLRLLVATDLAARGLDIKGLPLVVSWVLAEDPDVHVHRVGRTGRAGEKGLAVALVGPDEVERAKRFDVTWGELDLGVRGTPVPPAMVTLEIDGGREDKLRPGDLLGALTGDVGLAGDAIGKIDIGPARSFVAVAREHADVALKGLRAKKIKGRSFRVYRR
jgi:ATP-independent RNA helicase DbpA